jgi:hypothetical protein
LSYTPEEVGYVGPLDAIDVDAQPVVVDEWGDDA